MNLDRTQLLAIFLEEAGEHLITLEQKLLELEKSNGVYSDTLIHDIFRAVHSIKGNAPMVGLVNIANLSHNMENCIELIREKILPADSEMISTLLIGYDKLNQLFKDIDNSDNISITEESDLFSIIVTNSKKKSLHNNIAEDREDDEVHENSTDNKEKKKSAIQTMRVPVKLLDELMLNCNELVLARNQLLSIINKFGDDIPELTEIAKKIDLFTYLLQDEVINTRMQPISNLFDKLPRLVKELGVKLGKKINFELFDNDVQIDKSINENLSDALTHIIRNSADHGIEDINTRLKKGKDEIGTIRLTAHQKGSRIYIEIYDDGQGFDTEKIIAKALDKNLINQNDVLTLSHQDIYQLALKPGFTTAKVISSVSGRGVGLDVVKTNVDRLNGSVVIDSKYGESTTITIILPLTVSIMNALILKTGESFFAIPQASIEEVVQVKERVSDSEKRVEYVNQCAVLWLRNRFIPLVSLRDLLALPAVNNSQHTMKIIIIKYNYNFYGLLIDEFLTNDEIVIKSIPCFFKRQTIYSGTTILSNGAIALVLDTMSIVASANLNFNDINEINEKNLKKGEEIDIETPNQSILIFENAKDEYFGIALDKIKKVIRISKDKIIKVGDYEYIEHDGHSIQFLRLDKFLPVGKIESDNDKNQNIIIIKSSDIQFGILAHKIIDNNDYLVKMNTENKISDLTIGSAIINEKLIIFPDVDALKTKLLQDIGIETKKNLKEILALDKNLTISTAESCTGGLLASYLTSLVGSSSYFKGSVVAYSNQIKQQVLGVSKEILNTYGAVSEETAREMLLGCKRLFQTDITCSITGFAGPKGGTAENPVGTVFIGVDYNEKTIIEKCMFKGYRDTIRLNAVEKAISMITIILENK